MHFRQFCSGSSIPLERDGRRFPKGGAVRHRKAPKLNELMISGDLRDARCRRIGPSQRPARLVQSLQQKISRRAYAEEFGATGRGLLEQSGLTAQDVPLLVGTLGKAFGSFGAFIAGCPELIEELLQHARPYRYTTALPQPVAAATAGV